MSGAVKETPKKKVRLHRPESHAPGLSKNMRMPTTAENMLSDVTYQKSVLAGQWASTVKNLMFQLPQKDTAGLPANIHLLDTLRNALAIYQQMAAWSHVEGKLAGRM